MKELPTIPRVGDATDDLLEGHLWLLEKIDGAPIRFQLQESGLIRFGDRTRVYDDPAAVPEPSQHAVRHVQSTLDRRALRHAVDDVESLVFFGEATHRHTIEYDWDRIPSVLGFDVWSAEKDGFYPVDTVEQIFDRLGLESVNVFERERRARDFDPDSYSIPESAWYDGPAEGVVVRNKRGQRAKLLNPSVRDAGPRAPLDGSASEVATAYATQQRFERIASTLTAQDLPITFETLFERVLEDIVRQNHDRLYHAGTMIDMQAFRSEVGALTNQFLEE